MRDTPRLTDEEARAVWQRAAELQAAAEHAAQRSRTLRRAEPGELSLEHVTEAARGAGIDVEFVHLALAEQRLPDAAALGHHTWKARLLERLVDRTHAIERQRTIGADPATVTAVLRRVATSGYYALVPESRIASEPGGEGVFVYRIDHASRFGVTMNLADARVLLVSVRPHEDGTIVRVRVPLFRRGVNLAFGSVMGSVFGAGGGALGGGLAASLGAGALLFALPAAAGVITGGAIGITAFRALYRAVKGQGETAVDRLLQTVAADAESAGPGEDRALPR